MKEIWKKLHKRTAVALTVSMLATSVMPITGLAQTFEPGTIWNEEADEGCVGYVATASVAAKVAGGSENEIELASGSNSASADIYVEFDVTANEVATASDASVDLASSPNWNTVKDNAEQAIGQRVTMTATVSDVDPAIEGYIEDLDVDELESAGKVTVAITVPDDELVNLNGSYDICVTFEPEVDKDDLPEGIVVDSISSDKCIITITIGDAEDTQLIKFKDFYTGEELGTDDDGNVETEWIYVGDDPVDLKDYCITDQDTSAISFTSSAPDVASIDGSVLTPESNGVAVITAEIQEGDQVIAAGELTVQVWTTAETSETMPAAFEIYEGREWEHIFEGRMAGKKEGYTCIFNEDGTVANEDDEARVSVKVAEDKRTTTVNVKGKKPGKYTLRCAWHDDIARITYYGYVDFTVKSEQSAEFSINGFNEDDEVNDDGVLTTWIYLQDKNIPMLSCTTPVGLMPTITYTSSNTDVATVDDYGWLYPHTNGRTTITATMTAEGREPLTSEMIVQVWDAREQHNLPDELTMQQGEVWTRTFAEPLNGNTEFAVEMWQDGDYTEVGDDFIEVSLSADKKTMTIKAKEQGGYYLHYYSHKDETLVTKYEDMYIEVLEAGVSLDLSVSQLVLEPGASASFDVTYTPEDAKVELLFYEASINAVYADGKVTVTAADLEESTDEWLWIGLYKGEGESKELVVEKEIPVYIVKKQLEATTVEEALAESSKKIEEAIENSDEAEVEKIVDEVAKILTDAPQSELNANKDAIDGLEAILRKTTTFGSEVYTDKAELEVSGALLNLVSLGEDNGKIVVEQVEDAENADGITLDIKLQRGSTGKNITKLAAPMQIRIKATGIDLTKNIRIRHTKEDGSANWIYPAVDGEYIVFWVDSFSEFAISNYITSNHDGGGGGGGSSSSSTSAAGTVSSDAKKGYVNSVTGIVTGSGAGYSQWNQDTVGWKLQYADGTFAAGTMVTDEAGNTHEQVAWEMINGAWYPFGADGYAKVGMVYDAALGGTFYVDITSGMKTGWQQIDGVWHYFNTASDGKRGIMLVDTTVDGYYIDAEGIWK